MDVGDDKTYRRGTLVFDPMRPGAEFGEDLPGLKFLDRADSPLRNLNPLREFGCLSLKRRNAVQVPIYRINHRLQYTWSLR